MASFSGLPPASSGALGQYAAKEGYAWLAGLNEVRNIGWVDIPTSHWPMWSQPKELAQAIGDVANSHAAG